MRIGRLAGVVLAAACGLCTSMAGAKAAMPMAGNSAHAKFFLKAGDRVCFYGDSITEQRFYGVDTQTYAITRFPNMKVMFVNAGVGGDKVTGGWAGPINVRLKRDVFPFKPNVVTIMLGMNDAAYQAFNPAIFNTYRQGYIHLVNALKRHLPGVKIILIQPSPYDDITQPLNFPGGYNAVLLRYAAFVKRLAAKDHLMCVNFNRPLVNLMKQLMKKSKTLAAGVVPGRVHPSPVGQLIMAAALLKAWHAPSLVSAVRIKSGHLTAARNTVVTHLSTVGGLSWVQKDRCLPMPMMTLHENWPQFPPEGLWPAPQPNFSYNNPLTAAVLQQTHLYRQLDREMLRVGGLAGGQYRLEINGAPVGVFSASELAKGINLARYPTPMLKQAYHVMAMVWRFTEVRFYAWRHIELPVEGYFPPWTPGQPLPVSGGKAKRIAHLDKKLVNAIYSTLPHELATIYAAARPQMDHYQLVPVK